MHSASKTSSQEHDKIFAAQNLPTDVSQVMDQLERHCLAPDGSLFSKSTYYDVHLVLTILSTYKFLFIFVLQVSFVGVLLDLRMEAREEMCKERQCCLKALIENSEKKVLMGKQRAVSIWPRAVLAADASVEV
ncbi:UNVERIFIED_CONTAM: AUGMIN subunit, partial [Sesamum radiatum]